MSDRTRAPKSKPQPPPREVWVLFERLAVAARSALPVLLAELRAARQVVEAARGALDWLGVRTEVRRDDEHETQCSHMTLLDDDGARTYSPASMSRASCPLCPLRDALRAYDAVRKTTP